MTFTRVDAIRIVVFAGYNRNEMRRTNEVHILDISDVSIWVGVCSCSLQYLIDNYH